MLHQRTTKSEETGGSGGGIHIKKVLTEEEISEFKEIFSLVDSDGSGEIDQEELCELMRTLGLVPSKEEILQMMKEVDADGNGMIDFDEFTSVMSKEVKTKYSQKDLINSFKVFEDQDDEAGFVKVKTLIHALVTYGNEKLTQKEAVELISLLDLKDGNKINYVEQITMLSSN